MNSRKTGRYSDQHHQFRQRMAQAFDILRRRVEAERREAEQRR